MPFTSLEDRAVVGIAGQDAEHFLDNLITCQVVGLAESEARFGALLTPQGKILYDFFVIRVANGYFLDALASNVDELFKRLVFYRLRAKVDIEIRHHLHVTAFWQENPSNEGIAYKDPRHPDLGIRLIGDEMNGQAYESYQQHRINCAIAESGLDFAYSEAYPHEVLMDQFGGVDFKKGCYVGQEVVSRMQHRGTTKKRVVRISSSEPGLETGQQIFADGKPAGTVGSVSGNRGLAICRLDRIHNAGSVTAGEISIVASLPDWVNFAWPEKR